jgi:serine/threonine protein kinase
LEEYISGSDLDSYRKKKGSSLDEREVANITLQIMTGLKDLHALGYIYRDLKPLNVMIQPNG